MVVTEGVTTAVPEVPEAVKPVPVQLVALVEDHVRVEDWPAVMEVGLAERETVGVEGGGGGGGVTEVVVFGIIFELSELLFVLLKIMPVADGSICHDVAVGLKHPLGHPLHPFHADVSTM